MAIDTSATRQMSQIDPRESLIAKLKPMFNDICILYDHELVRLIGFHEDRMDFYYLIRQADGNVVRASAVGHITSLKGIYPDERYEHMDEIFARNNCPREEEFQITGSPDEEFEWE